MYDDLLCADQELVHHQPANSRKFNDSEKNAEARRLQLIHALLAEKGELTIDQIYHCLVGGDELHAINPPFNSASELDDFVKNRSFVFAYDIFTEKARNRPFDYRSTFIQLARYIYTRNKNSCLRSQLMDFLKPEMKQGTTLGMKYRRDYPKQFDLFLKAHQRIFEEKGNEIRVKASAISSIPCLFLTDILPTIEQGRDLSGKQRETFWDKSNIFGCLGYVVSSTPNYAKAQIMCGPYEGKSVYVLCMNVNLGDISMTEEFPVGEKVELYAHYSYNAKCDYTATNIRKINSTPNIWKIRAGQIGIPKKTTIPPVRIVMPKSGVSQEKSREIEKEITKFMEREQTRLLLLCAKLKESSSLEELKMALAQPGIDPAFPTMDDIVDFIEERPHIFRKQTDPESGLVMILERNKMEEQVLLDVLKLISQYQPFGIQRNQLYKELKAGKCGTLLQEELIKGDFVFDGLIRELLPVLKSEARKEERFFSLIGTFYKDHFFPYLFF